MNRKIFKIPSLGSVVIGNNVEIGASTTIDRGTIENTMIGDDTKKVLFHLIQRPYSKTEPANETF